jgi:hypothetical protein
MSVAHSRKSSSCIWSKSSIVNAAGGGKFSKNKTAPENPGPLEIAMVLGKASGLKA